MKPLLGVLLLSATLALSADANIYSGTITCTIDGMSADTPGYAVGDTFSGFYQYDSPTVDVGLYFWTLAGPDPEEGVNIPNELIRHGAGTTGFYFDTGWAWPYINVVDGHVTDFLLTNENVFADWNFTGNSWELIVQEFWTGNGDGHFRAWGTVTISDPALAAHVDDSGGVLLLLTGSLLGLALLRRRLST